MGTDPVAEGSAASGRRSQNVARSRRRRRRPNIAGARHTVEVVLSDAEYATLQEAAAEANATVPWYLVQCAMTPVSSVGGSESGPWLPWPKRQALAATLASATGALDEIRLQHLAHLGANLNQIARAANITGTVAEDLTDTMDQLLEAAVDLRQRAERLEELAREVVRR